MKMFRKFRLTVTRGRAERKSRQLLFFLISDFISIRRTTSHWQTDFKEGSRRLADCCSPVVQSTGDWGGVEFIAQTALHVPEE